MKQAWSAYRDNLPEELEQLKEGFPFTAFVTYKKQDAASGDLVDLFKTETGSRIELIDLLDSYWAEVTDLFDNVAKLAALEAIRDQDQREDFIVNDHA